MTIYRYGILLFQQTEDGIQVLLAHPVGPIWAGKDNGAWSIQKGLQQQGETSLKTARPEFCEETGFEVEGTFIQLGDLNQPSGTIIRVLALDHDLDVTLMCRKTFSLDWPRQSGIFREYPEIDEGRWFCLEVAMQKISDGQAVFLDRLLEHLQ